MNGVSKLACLLREYATSPKGALELQTYIHFIMEDYKVFSQAEPPAPVHERCDSRDLGVLDKVTITKVTDFMQKFQADATFAPPTVDVLYDSDNYDVSVDDDVDSVFIDIEEMDDDIQRAREQSK